MAKRTSNTGRPKRGTGPTSRDVEKTTASFYQALGIIDGAVTGAILAGVHPYSFEPILSFWFLNCAGRARNTPKAVVESWVSGTNFIFDPIVQRVIEWAVEYDGQLLERGEEQELKALVEHTQARSHTPAELDLRRQNKQAASVIEWALSTLSQDEELPALLVEVALLVEWLKVAAIAGNIDDGVYLIVKQTAPMVARAYDDLLN